MKMGRLKRCLYSKRVVLEASGGIRCCGGARKKVGATESWKDTALRITSVTGRV